MLKTVGIGELIVSNNPDDTLVTYSLGSCIGIAAFDSKARVGGMIHYKLASNKNMVVTKLPNLSYGDIAIPQLFHEMYKYGAQKRDIRIVMAGGMSSTQNSMFRIGEQNILIARKLFWKNGVFIDAEDVGGSTPRTLYLKMETGETWFESKRVSYPL